MYSHASKLYAYWETQVAETENPSEKGGKRCRIEKKDAIVLEIGRQQQTGGRPCPSEWWKASFDAQKVVDLYWGRATGLWSIINTYAAENVVQEAHSTEDEWTVQ